MKSYRHMEDATTLDVLHIASRDDSKKILNNFHNMNMNIELMFRGDQDLHIDMSLCLCYKRLA